jgi:uracil-DNA glycosylase
MRVNIDQLITAIADYQAPKVFNPWSQSCPNEISNKYYLQRRKNLKAHLSCPDPLCIIIGEALGYRGARFTGVPFTSEKLLVDQAIPRVDHPKGERITTRHIPWKEPSATIIWEELHKHQVADRTILFNAVPWHPEGKDGPLSNRAPNAAEKKAGQECLSLFFKLFQDIPVMALGNIASESLNRLSIAHTKIRHPANDGAPLFRAGASVFFQKCLKPPITAYKIN